MLMLILSTVWIALMAVPCTAALIAGRIPSNTVKSDLFNRPTLTFNLESVRFHGVYSSKCIPCKNKYKSSLLERWSLSSDVSNEPPPPPMFHFGYAVQVILGQALLIPVALVAATLLHIPAYGLGYLPNDTDFITSFIASFNKPHFLHAAVATIPLLAMAAALDSMEQYSSALQGVTRASLRSVLLILGNSTNTLVAITISLLISIAAGFGEEILFRGVVSSELVSLLSHHSPTSSGIQHVDEWIAIIVSGILFGALHAITLTYAAIATIAGIYFGYLQVTHDHELAVPIMTHSLYDFVAFMYAHIVVSKMTPQEQQDLLTEE